MIKKLRWLLLLLVGLACVPAFSQTQEAKLRKLLQNRLGADATVEAITKTPYAGLYEAKVGKEIIYTDAEAHYVFIGHVFEAETMKDLTQAKLDDLSRIKFSELPLDMATKSVKGNGKRVIAVFEDPNCGYCKRFRKGLADVKDITVYTFMYPILGEDSTKKAKDMWCAPDRAKAWDDWMIDGKAAPQAPESCNASVIDKVVEMGKRYNVTGTPTIIFSDGTRIPGAIDAKALEIKLARVKQP